MNNCVKRGILGGNPTAAEWQSVAGSVILVERLGKRRRCKTHQHNCGNECKFGFLDNYLSPSRDKTRHVALVVASWSDIGARPPGLVSRRCTFARIGAHYFVRRKACMRKLNGRKASINSRSRDLRESGWRPTSQAPAISK